MSLRMRTSTNLQTKKLKNSKTYITALLTNLQTQKLKN